MIKGFGWAETNSTLFGPGLKGIVHCLEEQQTNPWEGIGFMYWQFQSKASQKGDTLKEKLEKEL